jgi:flagellar assembly factor FliW
MKTGELEEPQELLVRQETTISMPFGLLGFEQAKAFDLWSATEEQPFLRLQMRDNPEQGFVVVPPSVAAPQYAPDLAAADVDFLGLKSAAEALVLNIVTVRGGSATVNLKGPIVINRQTLVGKQCIPTNVGSFSLQHPIAPVPVAA